MSLKLEIKPETRNQSSINQWRARKRGSQFIIDDEVLSAGAKLICQVERRWRWWRFTQLNTEQIDISLIEFVIITPMVVARLKAPFESIAKISNCRL